MDTLSLRTWIDTTRLHIKSAYVDNGEFANKKVEEHCEGHQRFKKNGKDHAKEKLEQLELGKNAIILHVLHAFFGLQVGISRP